MWQMIHKTKKSYDLGTFFLNFHAKKREYG